MIQVATPTEAKPPGPQMRLRWRLLIYFAIWLVAATILATCSELYLDDDSTETSSRWLVFATAPIVASMGLDFAILSAWHGNASQVGVLTWLIVVGFGSHALFMFSCARRASFSALIAILIIALSIGVCYALRFYHLDATAGHG